MAEAQEGLWMSARERDRLKVLHEVGKRHITQKQAGVELGLSTRWVRTLLKRLRREGDTALRHRLRGRPSNRKMPEAVKRRCVAWPSGSSVRVPGPETSPSGPAKRDPNGTSV